MTDQKTVSQTQSFSLALQGFLAGIIIVFLSLLSLDLGILHFGFSFLPVFIIYFWPCAASYTWSLFFIFLLGMYYDIASANPLGIWTLTFLILFMTLDGVPKSKSGLGITIIEFSLCVMFSAIVAFLFGWLSLGRPPQIVTLFGNAVASIVVFPIFYWLRSLFVTIRSPSMSL